MLDGEPLTDPVVLNAPLDWPDCCALCSNIDDANGMTTAACDGWSFSPATGSCQLMSSVSLDHNASSRWSVNGTINGYPGYLKAPAVRQCMLWETVDSPFLWIGIVTAIFGLCLVCWGRIVVPSEKASLLREILLDPTSRLQKATCVEVSSTRVEVNGETGRCSSIYKGTFRTRDGAEFVVHRRSWDVDWFWSGRTIEHDMLMVLFSKRLKPMSNHTVPDWMFAARLRMPEGLKSEFSSILRNARAEDEIPQTPISRHHPEEGLTSTVRHRHHQRQGKHSSSFDCLLLVGGGIRHGRRQWARPQVGQKCVMCQ